MGNVGHERTHLVERYLAPRRVGVDSLVHLLQYERHGVGVEFAHLRHVGVEAVEVGRVGGDGALGVGPPEGVDPRHAVAVGGLVRRRPRIARPRAVGEERLELAQHPFVELPRPVALAVVGHVLDEVAHRIGRYVTRHSRSPPGCNRPRGRYSGCGRPTGATGAHRRGLYNGIELILLAQF